MRLIREVEQRLSLLFSDGEIPGFIHLSIGQEAVAVGIAAALQPHDTLASNHRGHGHALAKGLDVSRFFLEIMGRSEGYCGGRGGSMHVADMSVGMLGANGIVGAGLPIAVGSALAHQLRKTGGIACVFFGDGALAEGALHESFNLASLVEASAAVCLREQRLVRILAGLATTRDGTGKACRGFQDFNRSGGRQRCHCRSRCRCVGDRSRPRRRRSVPDRVQDHTCARPF